MKAMTALLALLVLAGCGGPAGDPLQGTWVAETNNGLGEIQVAFQGDTWEMDTMSALNGLMAVQVDSGTYAVSGSTMTLTTAVSSCQGLQPVTKTTTATFSCGGGYLTLNLGATVLQFHYAKMILGTTEIGCFDSQNNFTPNAVASLP
jgi:hypothetical protein